MSTIALCIVVVAAGSEVSLVRTFDLAALHRTATGIGYSNGNLYVIEDNFLIDDSVYVYSTSGEWQEEAEFSLDEANRHPGGIASADGRFYVTDENDRRVYAYDQDGQRNEELDFDLHSDNGYAAGITYAEGRFYVVDQGDEKVYVYQTSGERVSNAEFELSSDNSVPDGITYASGKLFVLDWSNERVYGYTISGERDATVDFNLSASNVSPEGIVYAESHYFVVDDLEDKVFVYKRSGDSEIGLQFVEGLTAERAIDENIPGGIYIGEPITATGQGSLTYSLEGNDSENFAIIPATGQIRTVEGVLYDYETNEQFTFDVSVSDSEGNRETIGVDIAVDDLAPSCTLVDHLKIRSASGNESLNVRWNALPNQEGHARIQGYEVEIKRGSEEVWTNRRTILGRKITGIVYSDLDNDIGYEIRVRPINAEGECEWSDPVVGIPSSNLAPENSLAFHQRFGPYSVGSAERNFRLLTPGRCRYTTGETSLDANCSYEQTDSQTGSIELEFDDPSAASCSVSLVYSSLTAGSFTDECFGAGVNVQVPFDRGFRLPPEETDLDAETSPITAPRTQEEFENFVKGKEDLIPGMGFGCIPIVPVCESQSGYGYIVEQDPETGLSRWILGTYTYENEGASKGVLTFTTNRDEVFELTMDFDARGTVQISIEQTLGSRSSWPGLPEMTFGTEPPTILLPIPPSWEAAIAFETDFAPEDWEDWYANRYETHSLPQNWEPVLFGDLHGDLFSGPSEGLTYFQSSKYDKRGQNRSTITVAFDYPDWMTEDEQDSYHANLTNFQKTVFGSVWEFDLEFIADGVVKATITVRKEGYLPTIVSGLVDFSGGSLDVFPDELLLPDEAPQETGEDVSGVEIAAAATIQSISESDVQTMLVNVSTSEYLPGDWLEPKDGGVQRMMIVGAGNGESQSSKSSKVRNLSSRRIGVVKSGWILPTEPNVSGNSRIFTHWTAGLRATDEPAPQLMHLKVVCMQVGKDIPVRGTRYFSKFKVAREGVETCQRECVLEGGEEIQGCVWGCEDSSTD